MKKWIIFLAIPLVVIWVLELVAAFIFGAIFNFESDGFVSMLSSFIIYGVGGMVMYEASPLPNDKLSECFSFLATKLPELSDKVASSGAYAITYALLGVLLAMLTDDTVSTVNGVKLIHEASVLAEFIKMAGLLLGVGACYQNEVDGAQAKRNKSKMEQRTQEEHPSK